MVRKVFIFGAGSSVHAGGPLNNQFIERIKENEENKSKYSDTIALLNTQLACFDNVEALLSIIDLSIMQENSYLPFSVSIEELKKIRKKLIQMIVNVIDEIDIVKGGVLVCRFFEKVGLQPEDTVINFNYDLVVDKALYNTGRWNPYKGVEEGSSGYGFSDVYLLDIFQEKDDLSEIKASTINYFKLHGSVNWATDYGEYIILNRDKFDPANKYKCNNVDLTSAVPFLIAPSFLKSIDATAARMNWLNAEKKVQQATEIYIAGYSFPKADALARNLLLHVNEEEIKKIVVIDPCGSDDAIGKRDVDTYKMLVLPIRENKNEFLEDKLSVVNKTLQEYVESSESAYELFKSGLISERTG